MEGQECHLAIDLASKVDLAALALVFPRQQGRDLHYRAFARCYLNEAAVLEARNASYPGWAAENWLTVTSGNETDFSVIEADVLDYCRRFRVLSVGYDPWSATQFAQRLRAEGVPMQEFKSTVQNFSEPIKELDAAVHAGRIEHDGNPVLSWCMGNVIGQADRRGNLYPTKQRPENKIDAAVSLIMGVARSMDNRTEEPDPYAGRGLLTF
jgi:phage terminase large subunit-like protein